MVGGRPGDLLGVRLDRQGIVEGAGRAGQQLPLDLPVRDRRAGGQPRGDGLCGAEDLVIVGREAR